MSEAVREQKERRISSPEELHDYMHVTGPGLWIMLTVIIGLMAALIITASTMKMENLMDVQPAVTPEGIPVMEVSAIAGWIKDTSVQYDDKIGALRITIPT